MKQKQLLKPLFLLCALLVGGLNSLWAQDVSTYQHVFNAKPSTGSNVTLSSVNWDITATNLNGYNSANYAGVQIGSKSTDGSITLTSSSDWNYNNKTVITEVRLWLNLGGTSVTPTVTIGGVSAISDGTTVVKNSSAGSDYTKATKVTFTPASNGNTGVIVINVATVKAGYICAMEIDCKEAGSASDTRTATTTTIDASGITNTDVYVSTEAGSLSATVKDEDDNTVTGATVTWSGDNDNVAKINESTGVVTLVAAGTVKFTATYEGDGTNYKGSTATYEMTVTSSAPYVQPTEFDVNLNNTLFGTDYNGTASGITDETPVSGTQDNVTVTYAGSGNHYINNSQIRFYPNNKLTFEAPDGYEITGIVFTAASSTWAATISADYGTYTSNTKTWAGKATSVTFTGSGSSRCDMSKATITLAEASNLPTPTVTISGDLTLDLNGGTNVSAGTLTAAVTYNDAAVQGATVTWSSSDLEVATIDENGAVTLLKTGKVTFTATFAETTEYNEATGTKTITVTDSKGPGSSAENAYTVAQARAAIEAGTGVTGVYATGKVSKIETPYSSEYGNISYYISADGTETSVQLLAYRGKSYNGANFTSENDIKEGDVVVVYGDLINYKGTYEFAANNQLVSLNRPVSISSVGYKAYNTTIDTDFSGTGVTAYVVTGYTAKSVTLEEVTAAPAGTPLVLKADGGGDYTLKAAKETPDAPDNLLQVSNGKVGDGSTIYALANVNGPGFYVVQEGLTIPTNYIVITGSNAPALSFDFGEGTTGIRSIENGQLTIDNVYYDLSGRKLNAMPTQKGVYIVNGKKVVIK